MAEDNDLWRGVGEFIRSQRELANLSLRQLAEVAKISNPYLSQIERGIHKPSADVLKSLASALQISAETMYAQAGLLDPPSRRSEEASVHSVQEAIRDDARLTAEQKDTLLRIYRGFVERA